MNEEGVLVQNGKFRVFEDGTIFRIKNGKEIKVRPTKGKMGRNGDVLRLTTSYSENGKQKHFLISSLVAEAYLPKKEIHTNGVKYIDGNPENCSLSNLMRETKTERLEILESAHAARRSKQVTCPECKEKKSPYKDNPENLCGRCFKIRMSKNNRDDAIKKEFEGVSRNLLDVRQEMILNMRLEGQTLQEIATQFDLTRERIRVILLDIKNIERVSYDKKYREIKSIEQKISYVEKRLYKIDVQKKRYEKELKFLLKQKNLASATNTN